MGYTVVPNQISNLSGIDDVNLSSVSQGAILYRNGSNEWTNLGAGNSGEALTTQGAGANPVWQAGGVWQEDGNSPFSASGSSTHDFSLNGSHEQILIIGQALAESDSGSHDKLGLALDNDTNSNYHTIAVDGTLTTNNSPPDSLVLTNTADEEEGQFCALIDGHARPENQTNRVAMKNLSGNKHPGTLKADDYAVHNANSDDEVTSITIVSGQTNIDVDLRVFGRSIQ